LPPESKRKWNSHENKHEQQSNRTTNRTLDRLLEPRLGLPLSSSKHSKPKYREIFSNELRSEPSSTNLYDTSANTRRTPSEKMSVFVGFRDCFEVFSTAGFASRLGEGEFLGFLPRRWRREVSYVLFRSRKSEKCSSSSITVAVFSSLLAPDFLLFLFKKKKKGFWVLSWLLRCKEDTAHIPGSVFALLRLSLSFQCTAGARVLCLVPCSLVQEEEEEAMGVLLSSCFSWRKMKDPLM